MNSRQKRILNLSSSIIVGLMAFCVTLLLMLLLGGILLGPLESEVLFPPQLAVLFLISVFVGQVVAFIVGKKYYRYLERERKK
jgi:positive regulator of sigma E activity